MVRSVRFDLLKAIAIISVICYHIGFQQYGYLGVDIFLVVAGYFLGRSLLKSQNEKKFSFFGFMIQKVLRLWPILLIASVVSLILGFFLMLPDDYENLSQAAFASNVFANNVLSAITTKNYWDVVNEFKPLMHTWYVGVLVQSYFVFAIVAKIAYSFSKRPRRFLTISIIIVSALSFLMFILPIFAEHEKFYYIFARFFELGIGAALAMLSTSFLEKLNGFLEKHNIALGLQIMSIAGLVVLLVLPFEIMPASIRLLLVNFLTAVLVLLFISTDKDWKVRPITWLSLLGKTSFSFFVWHQVILAFVRYAWSADLELAHVLICLFLTVMLSVASYHLLEVKLVEKLGKTTRKRMALLIICVITCFATCAVSLVINNNAGVVRDVPELGISVKNVKSKMHATYCDRIYAYDKDFSNNEKKKVLVLGNSFGRDFANILLESEYAEKIDLSYATDAENTSLKRIDESDYIFYVVFGNNFQSLPEPLLQNEVKNKVFIVGNKNFGENNGNIYNRRHKSDYFTSTIKLTEDYFAQDDSLKKQFGDKYISLIDPVLKNNSMVCVFTDDGKFISQDCRHLTSFGAKYYAKQLDFDFVFE